MKKILIATDGSATSRAAVEAGLELAEDEGAAVVFARVASILEFAARPDDNGSTTPDRPPRSEEDAVLCQAIDRAAERGVAASSELLIGNPARQILRLARDIDAGLIVVGSRGLGAVKSVILGSTSRDLLSHADRPVLVVRETVREATTA